jgi:hypothetical protein
MAVWTYVVRDQVNHVDHRFWPKVSAFLLLKTDKTVETCRNFRDYWLRLILILAFQEKLCLEDQHVENFSFGLGLNQGRGWRLFRPPVISLLNFL